MEEDWGVPRDHLVPLQRLALITSHRPSVWKTGSMAQQNPCTSLAALRGLAALATDRDYPFSQTFSQTCLPGLLQCLFLVWSHLCLWALLSLYSRKRNTLIDELFFFFCLLNAVKAVAESTGICNLLKKKKICYGKLVLQLLEPPFKLPMREDQLQRRVSEGGETEVRCPGLVSEKSSALRWLLKWCLFIKSG